MTKLFLALLLCSCILFANDKKNLKDEGKRPDPVLLLKEKEKKEVKDGEMKQYFLVLLKRGPMRNAHDSTTIASIQAAHLANIDRLYNERKIDIAGPFGHDGELRGIFIFNCETYDEVLTLCSTDPAIKAGRLVAEIYPWWGGKGSTLR